TRLSRSTSLNNISNISVKDNQNYKLDCHDNIGNCHEQSSVPSKEGSAVIGKAEMLQMRRWMVKMVEELKIKRRVVLEAEMRAEALAEQLHTTQIHKDSELEEAKQREEKLEHSLARLRQQCEDRLKACEVEKIQQQVYKESNIHVQEKSRNEIRQLKTQLRQKEKQTCELEAQLQTEKTASAKLLSQWREAEGKLAELGQLYQACEGSITRLEESVVLACAANRRLSHKQEQHATAMLEKVRQINDLEAELVKARVQISELAVEAVKMDGAEARVAALNATVLQLKQENKRLEEQMEQEWQRRK
ncbi:hypothetical protein EGW08_011014, partial [Elysia chlorotica]